jgi:hypothetical protein
MVSGGKEKVRRVLVSSPAQDICPGVVITAPAVMRKKSEIPLIV